jgi:hypothetical protein
MNVSLAQTVEVSAKPLTEAEIRLLQSDVQSAKNKVIADTMQFTEAESTSFWPLYNEYAQNQQMIANERLGLMKNYAETIDKMNDAIANDLAQRSMGVDTKFLRLRQDYWPKFEKTLGPKRAAKFYQVDSRLTLMINLELTSQIPLIP